MKLVRNSFLVFICLFFQSCIDPFEAPIQSADANHIVIEGFINSTEDKVRVSITRSVPLSNPSKFEKVLNAQVVIIDSNESELILPMTEPGVYELSNSFDQNLNYQLKVVTANNSIYASDFVSIQKGNSSNVSYTTDSEGLTVQVTTEGTSVSSKYYKYSYDETFEYNSRFFSAWKFSGSIPTPRAGNEYIYTCWLSQPSTNILLATSEGLTKNLISNKSILKINKGDRRLWNKYSILVKQAAIDRKEFQYWSDLSKTSESLGGLFDPVPFAVKGNIKNVNNSNEVVLGYFSAGEVSTTRLTIKNSQLPSGFDGFVQNDCVETLIPANEINQYSDKNIILTNVLYSGITIVGYYSSLPVCVDCQLGGGTTVEPEFMK